MPDSLAVCGVGCLQKARQSIDQRWRAQELRVFGRVAHEPMQGSALDVFVLILQSLKPERVQTPIWRKFGECEERFGAQGPMRTREEGGEDLSPPWTTQGKTTQADEGVALDLPEGVVEQATQHRGAPKSRQWQMPKQGREMCQDVVSQALEQGDALLAYPASLCGARDEALQGLQGLPTGRGLRGFQRLPHKRLYILPGRGRRGHRLGEKLVELFDGLLDLLVFFGAVEVLPLV